MPKSADRRREPQPQTRGMLHRAADPTCPLCSIWGVPWVDDRPDTWNRQHEHAERLWQQWAAGGPDWPHRVCDVARELGVQATPEQARTHFARHGVEQPAMSGPLDREPLLMLTRDLSPRLQSIIRSVYRHRLMTTTQIRELFYADGRSEAAATKKAKEELLQLAQHHLLYRYLPSRDLGRRRGAPPRLSRQAIWMLGKAAVPFIEETTGQTVWRDQYVQMAKEVRPTTIIHDLRAVSLYVAVSRALREREGLLSLPDRQPVIAETNPVNWYGPKHLAVGFYDRHRLQDREVRPDGFFTLSVHRASYLRDDALPSTQLPCFIEYDRGSRDVRHVVEQLFSYHLLALSGRPLQRFPDLAVRPYAIPVVMVFSDRDRMTLVHERVQARVRAETGYGEGAPIFLCAEEDWLENPFADNLCYSAWHDYTVRIGLLPMLVRASRTLIDRRALWAEQTLRIDTRAARPQASGTHSAEGMRRAREVFRRQADTKDNLAPATPNQVN
jgi:hypothetical protein